jgi:hypothetical protein
LVEDVLSDAYEIEMPACCTVMVQFWAKLPLNPLNEVSEFVMLVPSLAISMACRVSGAPAAKGSVIV